MKCDPKSIGGLVTEDVVWVAWADGVSMSGAVHKGRVAILEIVGDVRLRNEMTRTTEEGEVVVVEGTCHVARKDGRSPRVRFCNLFGQKDGTVERRDSFEAWRQDATE